MARYFLVLLTAVAAFNVMDVSYGMCTFEYLSQPPTQLSCNPYDDSSGNPKWRPTVSCVVARQYGMQSYKIQWFYKNSTHTTSISATKVFLGDLILSVPTSLQDAPYTDSLTGYYWCQASVSSTNDEYIPIERSNILEVQEPDYYQTMPPCPNILWSDTRCADLGSEETTPTTSSMTTESPATSNNSVVWKDATIAMICIIICVLVTGVVLLCVVMLYIILKNKKVSKSKEHKESKRSLFYYIKPSTRHVNDKNANKSTEPDFETSITQSQRSYAYVDCAEQQRTPPESATSRLYLQLLRDNEVSPEEKDLPPKIPPKPSPNEPKKPIIPRKLVDGHYYTVTSDSNRQEQTEYQDLNN